MCHVVTGTRMFAGPVCCIVNFQHRFLQAIKSRGREQSEAGQTPLTLALVLAIAIRYGWRTFIRYHRGTAGSKAVRSLTCPRSVQLVLLTMTMKFDRGKPDRNWGHAKDVSCKKGLRTHCMYGT